MRRSSGTRPLPRSRPGFYFSRCLAHAFAHRFPHFSSPLLRHALVERIHDVNDLRGRLAFLCNRYHWRPLLNLRAEKFTHGVRVAQPVRDPVSSPPFALAADLHNPAHFASLSVGRCPSKRLKFITRENCFWVLSPQLSTGKPPGCLAFPTRHLEASSTDRNRNLISMYVDH